MGGLVVGNCVGGGLQIVRSFNPSTECKKSRTFEVVRSTWRRHRGLFVGHVLRPVPWNLNSGIEDCSVGVPQDNHPAPFPTGTMPVHHVVQPQ